MGNGAEGTGVEGRWVGFAPRRAGALHSPQPARRRTLPCGLQSMLFQVPSPHATPASLSPPPLIPAIPLIPLIPLQVVVDAFDPSILVSGVATRVFDFSTATEAELRVIELPLELTVSAPTTVHGVATWFDVLFAGSAAQRWLSTAPGLPTTHWCGELRGRGRGSGGGVDALGMGWVGHGVGDGAGGGQGDE